MRTEHQHRVELCERLRLQADLLCESYKSKRKSSVILSRMMLIMLELVNKKELSRVKRQALADHFTDCVVPATKAVVELGGGEDRDHLYLDGTFDVGGLAKRLAWGEARTGQTIEVDNADNKAEGLS